MKQKELSRLLRGIVIIGWIACALLACPVAPKLAHDAAVDAPELAYLAYPLLSVFWIALAIVAVALLFGWKIFGEIGRDNSFCPENARRLRIISWLALADTVLCIVCIMALLLLRALHPGIFLLLLLIAVIGSGIAVSAAALSHLTLKASALQTENDLTI